MRFRAKFEWPLMASSMVWAGLCLAWFHKEPHAAIGWAYLLIGFVWLLLVALLVSSYLSFSWEVGEGGLVQRHFWSERTILWGEVTGVRQWGKAKRTGRCLVLNYARTGPMSERGELRIKPVEFDALVRALRDHAPQAEYDLLPARG
jgi:hypothetical protein